ncbi:peptidoglycan-binding protein [Candidatus Gracilibacteria bacterium]|nr:peptidoglycan-binding protein [Candidatus Gracilibacteria bacterium]
MKKISIALVFSFLLHIVIPFAGASATFQKGEEHTFTITGYYSPLPNQEYYVTGDYWSEIRLNGYGTNGADGTPVFPGMIAAPRTIPFGTKIKIPGLGMGAVHDRGGAIVNKGERDLAKHDRLDVWMGYGMEGLRRALAFGVQHLDCEIFSSETPIHVGMNFEVPPMLQEIVSLPEREGFYQNLALGSRGENVEALQEALNKLGFFGGLVDGIFDERVRLAVLEFQKKYFIVEDALSVGAGIFGPQTRSKLSSVLYERQVQETIRQAWETFHFEEDISRGKRNADVLKLQQILVEEEFMHVTPTGFFGPVTEEALSAFQLEYNIIRTLTAQGAGKVGPQTRAKLNEILEQKKQERIAEQNQILVYQKKQDRLRVLARKNISPSLAQK